MLAVVDAWNTHDLDRMETFYAPDFEGHDVARAAPRQGPQQARDDFAALLRALPDLRFEVESVVVEGAQAAVTWSATGTHAGVLLNIPPTGKRVRVRGASMVTVRDGKIAASSAIWDVAGLLRSLGLLPEL